MVLGRDGIQSVRGRWVNKNENVKSLRVLTAEYELMVWQMEIDGEVLSAEKAYCKYALIGRMRKGSDPKIDPKKLVIECQLLY